MWSRPPGESLSTTSLPTTHGHNRSDLPLSPAGAIGNRKHHHTAHSCRRRLPRFPRLKQSGINVCKMEALSRIGNSLDFRSISANYYWTILAVNPDVAAVQWCVEAGVEVELGSQLETSLTRCLLRRSSHKRSGANCRQFGRPTFRNCPQIRDAIPHW